VKVFATEVAAKAGLTVAKALITVYLMILTVSTMSLQHTWLQLS